MPTDAQPSSALRPSDPPQTPVAVLAVEISAHVVGASDDAVVTGVELRGQAVRPGDLFAALPGNRSHGASFAQAAVEQGATAVLTDDAGRRILEDAGVTSVPILVHPAPRSVLGTASATIYGRPSEKMQVIAITGTSGKTTTSYLVEAGLTAGGRKPGLIGTIETRIEGQCVPSALTTPEAPNLHALFAAMLEQGIDTVVMEVSSHALSLGRVDGTRFEVGAFTNLSQDHLDFHETFEDYFAAKARLFAADSSVRARRSVVCVDDEWGVRMAEVAAAGPAADRPITVSTLAPAQWRAQNIDANSTGGQRFEVEREDADDLVVELRLPGRYNVANATLAIAVCAAAGVDPERAASAMATVDVPGRVERVERGQNFLAV
ncbi:MAG: UDP-N-acetylmuramoyl-L-alanyl-D-glutamate--2,6-diaminopimelate ligase, partial [Rhodococcus fascians]